MFRLVLLLLPMLLAGGPPSFTTVEVCIPMSGRLDDADVTYVDIMEATYLFNCRTQSYELTRIRHQLEIVGASVDPKIAGRMVDQANSSVFLGVQPGRLKMLSVLYSTCDRGRGKEPEVSMYFEERIPGDMDWDEMQCDFTAAFPTAQGVQ